MDLRNHRNAQLIIHNQADVKLSLDSRPWQAGHAPSGELKENTLGLSSGINARGLDMQSLLTKL